MSLSTLQLSVLPYGPCILLLFSIWAYQTRPVGRDRSFASIGDAAYGVITRLHVTFWNAIAGMPSALMYPPAPHTGGSVFVTLAKSPGVHAARLFHVRATSPSQNTPLTLLETSK